MAEQFSLTILTGSARIYQGNVEYVTVPGVLGSFGVLAHHVALLAALKPGVISLRNDQGKERSFQLKSKGFAKIKDNAMTIIAFSLEESHA